MRVKIKEKSNVPKLEFGKTYEIKVANGSWSYRFKFTRRNFVYMTELDHSVEFWEEWKSIKISKRKLKRLLNDIKFTKSVEELIMFE